MLKKRMFFVAFCITVSFCLFVCYLFNPTYAATVQSQNFIQQDSYSGQLISDDGHVVYVPVKMKEFNQPTDENGLLKSEYEYYLTGDDFSQSNSAYDGSYAVKGTVTLYYKKKSEKSKEYYCLKSVKVSWKILSKSVLVTKAHVVCGCSSTMPPVTQTYEKDVKTSGSLIQTGFSKYVPDAPFAGCGAHSTYYLKQSGSNRTWTFKVTSTLISN
nr:hypothetical protein [uncultured Eubacterium sp.]